jgi:hypothetical protein
VELGKAKKHTDGGEKTVAKLKDFLSEKDIENKSLKEELAALQSTTRDKDHTLQSMRQKCRALEREVQASKESIATLTTANRRSNKRKSVATSHSITTATAATHNTSLSHEPAQDHSHKKEVKKQRRSLAPTSGQQRRSLAPNPEKRKALLAPVSEDLPPPASVVKPERKKVTFISPTIEKAPSNLKAETISFTSRPSNLMSAPVERSGAAPISLFQDQNIVPSEKGSGAPRSVLREGNAKDFIIRGGTEAKGGALANLTNSPRKSVRQSKRNTNNGGLKAATRIHQAPTPSRMKRASRVPTNAKSAGGWNPF